MFSVSNVTRRISLWPVPYQWRDYFSNLMQFAAFARAIVCPALLHVLVAERRSQVGGSRLCSRRYRVPISARRPAVLTGVPPF